MDWKDRFLFPVIGPILKSGLWLVSRARLPRTKGRIQVDGLSHPVEILRDEWGVAHIYGQNARDVLFGQGFVHAQERLWQMDFTRRVIFGRLSEVVGEAALPVDRTMRTVSLFRAAEQEANLEPGEFCDLLNAYCAGVNAWIEIAKKRNKLPVECLLLGYSPEPWQVKDTFGWGKLMCWTLAANWQSELYRRLLLEQLGPEKVKDLEIDIDKEWGVVLDLGEAMGGRNIIEALRPFAAQGLEEGIGSNNWVIHGSRTTTGKPILANDMHLVLNSPGIWYENHLEGGGLNVTGVSLPGVPMVIAGHNQKVAWGFTDSFADTQDLYEEHLRRDTGGGWEVEFKGKWLPAETRTEVIKIKGGKQVKEEVVTTSHGPVINALFRETFPDVPPMALRWTALDPGSSFQAIYQMNTAGSCSEFHEALRQFDDPSQNVVYADVDGNIGYTMNGRVPIRAKGEGLVPMPGWTGENEWTGYLPHEDHPHLFNPPRGYVATANNQIQREDFPHLISRDYVVSERIGRILEMIEAREKIDIGYIQKMHYDQTSISSRLVGRALGGLGVYDPDLVPIVAAMRTWDGKLDKDDYLSSIFEATIREAGRMMVDQHMGELGRKASGEDLLAGEWPSHLWEFFIRLMGEPDSHWWDLGHGETRDDVLRLALRKAVDYLKKELGPDVSHWKWGRLHQLTFNHILGNQKALSKAFNLGPFPMGGDGNTIAASYTSYCSLDPCPMWGPPYRFIADLSDLDHCWGVLAPGQSGHIASRHHHDGIRPWFEGTYHPVLFRRDEVEDHLETRLLLDPLADPAYHADKEDGR